MNGLHRSDSDTFGSKPSINFQTFPHFSTNYLFPIINSSNQSIYVFASWFALVAFEQFPQPGFMKLEPKNSKLRHSIVSRLLSYKISVTGCKRFPLQAQNLMRCVFFDGIESFLIRLHLLHCFLVNSFQPEGSRFLSGYICCYAQLLNFFCNFIECG